ncbi:ABC transporter ATP-binding protein [Candidatus Puniceispirillum sp.]|jgi:tungstate transport system ATP-binding protein|uniref:energy-coupling factor ABC transporter ATP-binding protein n=1 Tax=Candidatus Puniceispirillum sp. TaxID=2026719 RepID=UPI001EC2B3B8|nr:ABC transporter ATP-binding protein [Candidatus Puniceispirillum sp.]MBT6565912.1 ABC transporter ATP-binding protein [Candidatus Puniceispirillum sp.]
MSDNAIIKAEALFIIRNGTAILNEVTTHISKGKNTMLLGHNGAGKSLLLQALHGIITPDSGTISAPPAKSQKMVFQKPILLRRSASRHFDFLCPHLSPTEKIHWFKRAGLMNQMHTPARQLSGGEQQKLAFIGAMASKPDILFLDEPSANLDFEASAKIESLIDHAQKNGATIIMTTHNLAQARRLADHVLFIDHGKIIEDRSAKDFFANPLHDVAKSYIAYHRA